MIESDITLAVQELIEEDMKVIDEFIKNNIDPIADVGSPEKLIGKPFEAWTPEEKQWAVSVYGMNNPKLNKLAFDAEYASFVGE